ncbi:MAG: SDR family NAD(P)-dependent oxidoreductase [Ktedonobacterales bacterium]
MTGFLTGRTAVVTGSGRGIGATTAVALAQAGVTHLALVARSAEQLHVTAEQVRQAGAAATVFAADLLDLSALPQLAADIASAVGGVDILINNAATVAPLGPSARIVPDAFRNALTLNVVAPAALSAFFFPGMRTRGWGRIVNVSSGIAAHPETMIGGNSYATTKAALEAHTVNLAAEVAGTGVTVNIYRPGTVDTAMQAWIRRQDPAQIGEQLHARFVGYQAHGTLLAPEISGRSLVAHLSSADNGQVWNVTDKL